MGYHLVIYLDKKIHTQFHHRNIQWLAKAICQIKLCIFFENRNSLYYIRAQCDFSVTRVNSISYGLNSLRYFLEKSGVRSPLKLRNTET